MALFQSIFRLFGLQKERADNERIVRYAHSSHAQEAATPAYDAAQWLPAFDKPAERAAYMPKPAGPVNDLAFLEKSAELQKCVLDYLNERGREGAGYRSIDRYVLSVFIKDVKKRARLLEDKKIKYALRLVRRDLKAQGKIGFNVWTRVWYIVKAPNRTSGSNKKRFPGDQGLGSGWKPVADKGGAVTWLHENLTPDQFENFCIAILNTHCNVPMKITPKRAVSGADDGFDGIGEMQIHGRTEKVILQVKRVKPKNFIGADKCREFIGTMTEQKAKYAFYITTGLFSDRFRQSVLNAEENDLWIEMIDRDRLADIMLVKGDQLRGFGLYLSPLGLYYMNEDILRRAAS